MREQLHSSPADIAERSWRRVERIDTRVLALLERFALLLLRLSLGIVFVWFGILKITDQTPGELVADTVFWLNPDWFVPLLGVLEVLVGIGLLLFTDCAAIVGDPGPETAAEVSAPMEVPPAAAEN